MNDESAHVLTSAPDGMTDQDIDTAGTEADDGHEARIREHGVELHDPTTTPLGAVRGSPADRTAHGNAPMRGDSPDHEGEPSSPLVPDSMHRAEDDARARATSPDFSERPDRATSAPPSQTER